MPLYSYRCERGHHFDCTVKLDLSDAPEKCDFPMPEGECGEPVLRTITMPSRSFPGADSWRQR
jgi:predicted nucleic acid-binding Zn ribbon protein